MKSTIKSQDFEVIFNSLSAAKEQLLAISENFKSYSADECAIDTNVYKVWNDVLSSIESLNDIHDFVLYFCKYVQN